MVVVLRRRPSSPCVLVLVEPLTRLLSFFFTVSKGMASSSVFSTVHLTFSAFSVQSTIVASSCPSTEDPSAYGVTSTLSTNSALPFSTVWEESTFVSTVCAACSLATDTAGVPLTVMVTWPSASAVPAEAEMGAIAFATSSALGSMISSWPWAMPSSALAAGRSAIKSPVLATKQQASPLATQSSKRFFRPGAGAVRAGRWAVCLREGNAAGGVCLQSFICKKHLVKIL